MNLKAFFSHRATFQSQKKQEPGLREKDSRSVAILQKTDSKQATALGLVCKYCRREYTRRKRQPAFGFLMGMSIVRREVHHFYLLTHSFSFQQPK